VHSRVSIETYEMETPLYKLLQKEIEIRNTSSIDAEYTIKVVHLEKQTPIKN